VGATGVGSAVASCSNDVADAGCEAASEGGADSSSDKVSVCPGVVATRATKAARALVLPVVDSEDEAAVEKVGAAGSGRDSGAAPAFDGGADFAQRPEVDATPATEVGSCEGAAPEGVDAPAAGDVVAADEAAGAAPDIEDVVGANEPPGLAGRGGAFAAGGGEAGGAGRAGGTVGMADLGAVLGDVAVRADVADLAPGEVAAAGVVADAPDADVLEVGVPDAAGDPEGRLASVEVVETGLVASDARAVGMLVALELVARVGVASFDAEPDADPDAEVEAEDADADAAVPGAEAAGDPRAAPVAEGVGVAPVFADGAGARGAPPA
jgi:hypothetical protein